MRKIVPAFSILASSIFCQAQVITPVPSDGDSTVAVTLDPKHDAGTVALFSPTNAKEGDLCTVSAANAVALKSGVPTNADANSTLIVLVTDGPLQAGTPLCASIAGNNGGKVVLVKAPALPPGFDWGLVRAYFAAGSLMSQERDQFSHQDLFLSFKLDKVYWMKPPSDASEDSQQAKTKKKKAPSDGTYADRLHTYFEARLTALPVAVQSCVPSQASGGSASTGTSSPCSSSSSGSGSGSSGGTTPTQTFLNSQKSARLQFGAFYPLNLFPHWQVEGKVGKQTVPSHYRLFIAPLLETGFDTTLNSLNQTQQQSSTPTQVQPVGNSGQFYRFYDFGFRLGHDHLFTNPGSAPEEISYLNVGVGRFSNMASLLCPSAQYQGNNTCSAQAGTLRWQRDWRIRVEGLLQVPATRGFSVGFSSNVGLQHSSQAHFVHIQPADDLRFLFGYKFDITKIASKLAPQHF